MFPMTMWVKRLLVANIAMYFVSGAVPMVAQLMVLYPPQVFVRPWSLVTYMFLHGGMGHLIFNMIGLYFFGPRLEDRLGSKGFLWLYFLSGAGGALFSLIFSPLAFVVGASAGVYGVLLGFAMYWPRDLIYIYGVVPVQARWLAVALVAISLYSGITGSSGGTAHFAHLGGLAVGAGFLRLRDRHAGKGRREFQRKIQQTPSMEGSERDARRRWASIDLGSMHDLNRNEVEELLARVDRLGMRALSLDERRFLDRMSGG